jgi:hypothetical protein
MAEDEGFKSFIDTSVASDAVRPLLKELIGCFTFEEGEEVEETFSPEVLINKMIIKVSDRVDDVLERISNAHDTSAVPVILQMFTSRPICSTSHIDWESLYYNADSSGYRANSCKLYISSLTSPYINAVEDKLIGTLKKIVEQTTDDKQLFARYHHLLYLIYDYLDFRDLLKEKIGYHLVSDSPYGKKRMEIYTLENLFFEDFIGKYRYTHNTNTYQGVCKNLEDELASEVRVADSNVGKDKNFYLDDIAAGALKRESLRNAMDMIRKHYL